MTVLFWDIDGTLLTTARAGIAAWEGALFDVAGSTRSLDKFHTAGATDIEIAHRLLIEAGADSLLVPALVAAYEGRLPGVLGMREGTVLPNVTEILSSLQPRPDVSTLLLTGNTRRGARAKLRHYGLADYFDQGAFADDASDRPGIARVALSIARRLRPNIDPERTFVIGDTPADVACGRAIGARTLAVATGVYSVDQLTQSNPSLVFTQLPEPALFAAAIGLSL